MSPPSTDLSSSSSSSGGGGGGHRPDDLGLRGPGSYRRRPCYWAPATRIR